MNNRNATASWSGYSHQGQVGLLVALRKLQEDGIDLSNHFVEFENTEDIAIYELAQDGSKNFLSVHQVKAYYSDGSRQNNYIDVFRGKPIYEKGDDGKYLKDAEKKKIPTGAYESGQWCSNDNYLHTVVEVTDWDDNYAKTTDQPPTYIKRYPYSATQFHCDTTEIEKLIKDEFKKKDLHAFIHGNFKNENAKKVLDKNTYQRLRELYSSGKKFSFRYIARDINATRILEGKPSISKSTLINILKNDSTYMAMHLQRYGKEELNKFLPHPRRLSPLNSMSVVQMDGARINILTKDQGKLVFKYLIVAIDVSSSKVLAYRIVDVENFEAYFFIIQEIIERNLVLPQEIVLDNLTSLTSEKSLAFFDKMKTIGVNVRFHKKHNPQDKSQVENWFRIFNMNYLKDTYGFLGAGIKSKSKDSRPKDELTFEYRKPKNATSYEDLCKIIQSKIDKYNEEYIIPHTNTNPNLRFIDNKPENITKSEFITINRYLFYVESRIILNKSYISVTINGKIHEYMFYDNNYNFLKKYFNKYIIIRYNKQEPKYLYLYENKAIIKHTLKLNLYEKIPMAAHEMSKNQIVISKIHNYRLKKLKNNISNDLLDLRNNILEFDKIKKVKNIEDNIKLKVIPVDLINEKFDSKELINISLEEEYNRVEEDTLDILLNLKSLFKMKGSNDIIN